MLTKTNDNQIIPSFRWSWDICENVPPTEGCADFQPKIPVQVQTSCQSDRLVLAEACWPQEEPLGTSKGAGYAQLGRSTLRIGFDWKERWQDAKLSNDLPDW